MKDWNPVFRLCAILACPLMLNACVTVFPRSEPVELFRFGVEPDHPGRSASSAPQIVLSRAGSFSPAAAGDRLVAENDGQIVYVRGIRWVAPAEDLFRSAVAQTFQARHGVTYLLQPGDPGTAAYVLRYDVDRFELRYASTGEAPEAVVILRASLFRASDKVAIAGSEFEAHAPAAANRASVFPRAYDRVVGEALDQMADWVDRSVQAGS